jgi:hypothetical protein
MLLVFLTPTFIRQLRTYEKFCIPFHFDSMGFFLASYFLPSCILEVPLQHSFKFPVVFITQLIKPQLICMYASPHFCNNRVLCLISSADSTDHPAQYHNLKPSYLSLTLCLLSTCAWTKHFSLIKFPAISSHIFTRDSNIMWPEVLSTYWPPPQKQTKYVWYCIVASCCTLRSITILLQS